MGNERTKCMGNERTSLVLRMFVCRILKFIGAYAIAMIVFAGGIGENDDQVRLEIMEGPGCLGVTFDAGANKARGNECILSTPDSKVAMAVIATNEEFTIAREAGGICGFDGVEYSGYVGVLSNIEL